VHCVDDPWQSGDAAVQVFENGYLSVENGSVVSVGDAGELSAEDLSGCTQVDYRGKLIVPGFIDGHLHYPQTGVIASYGTQLLEWLEKYTFPAEAKFSDEAYAANAAEFFIKELLRNGTTSAFVYATVHEQSVDAIFNAAATVNMRLVSGKVMMDRNCPENLREPTSTDEQLELSGRLFNDNEGVYLQSHVAENQAEIDWVAKLFPWSRSYLDVYDHFGLLGERAIYGHCIYLDDCENQRYQYCAGK